MTQEYFSSHLSLSEWATKAKVSSRDALIREDAAKRKRLSFLAAAIGLPVVETRTFRVDEVVTASPEFSRFTETAGRRPFALRANPKTAGLPVLRNRKLSVPQLVDWLASTGVDGGSYELSFEPHIDPERAAIMVVADHRIIGEAIEGGILQLNKGLYATDSATRFEWNATGWRFEPSESHLSEFVQAAVSYLRVPSADQRALVETEMTLGFSGDCLKGYFEVISSQESGVVFIDYNRELVGTADGLSVRDESDDRGIEIVGLSGCQGVVRGPARVVDEQDLGTATIEEGDILVCRFTSPEFLPLMTAAAAVVTDVGGILSHAAIVCRELGKPCVIGARVATQKIRTGDEVEVDGTRGTVAILAASSPP